MRYSLSRKSVIIGVLVAYLLLRYLLPFVYCVVYQLLFLLLSCPNETYSPRTFDFKVNLVAEPAECGDAVALVIFVPSVAGRSDERRFVRSTWARPFAADVSVKMIFAVASGSRTSKDLRKESVEHNDILWLDFHEHYHNISLKIFHTFRWIVARCPNVRRVLRADPDIVLFKNGVDQLLAETSARTATIFGYCRSYDCVMRLPTSKTCVPRGWYSAMWYPNYCFGFSYLFTRDILDEILPLWLKRDYFPLDDILFTGLLVEQASAKINRLNFKSVFSYQTPFDRFSCDTKQVAAAAYEDLEKSQAVWTTYSKRCRLLA